MVVHHAVLLTPPIERRHEEAQTEHPPGECNFHTVILLQVGNGVGTTLRAALLQPVPEYKLHDLAILRAVETGASQDPILGNRLASRIGDWAQSIAHLCWHGLPTSKVKAGKAEQSQEDPAFMARDEVYHVDKIALKQLELDFSNEASRLQAELDAVEKKVENYDKIGEYAGRNQGPYEAAVKSMAAADRASVDVIRARLNTLKELLVQPTGVLVKDHLATAQKLKHKYKETHLALDAANSKHAGAKEGDAKHKAQVQVDEAQQEYNQAKDAFVRQLDVVEEAKQTILGQNLPKYREAVTEYHRKMAETVGAAPQ